MTSPSVAEVSERIRQLSLQSVEDIVEQTNKIRARIKQLEIDLKAAVDSTNYALATELQKEHADGSALLNDLRAAHDIALQLQKKRAREAATAGGLIIPTAAESAAKANEVWIKTMDDELARLAAAQDTVLLVLKTALKLASEAGSLGIYLRNVPSLSNITSEQISFFHLARRGAELHAA